MKNITYFQYDFLKNKLENLKSLANDRVKQGASETGSDGDGHHDEGYQLSMRETWSADNIANNLKAELSQYLPIQPVMQSEIVKIGNAILLNNKKIYIVDAISRAKSVISHPSIIGKKVGDKLGVFVIEKIFDPIEAEKIFWEENGGQSS